MRVKIDDMALMNYFRFGDNDDYQFVGANKDSDFYEVELGTQKLYSYKMTHDNRFAPNPLFGVLTLATCKPRMRQNMHVGEWIAGWTSKGIAHSPTEVGEEKLIYLAKVTKKLTIAEYWEQYPQKRPVNTDDKNVPERYGDNIYEPLGDGTFRQMPNVHHGPDKMAKDVGGKYVLVCEEFYYFSCLSPLEIPAELRPNVPKVQSAYGEITEDATAFIDYVKQHAGECKYTDAQ